MTVKEFKEELDKLSDDIELCVSEYEATKEDYRKGCYRTVEGIKQFNIEDDIAFIKLSNMGIGNPLLIDLE